MAKKLSFDRLPEAVERILEILSSEGSEHSALPELIARVALLEKKIDYLQRTLSPDRPVMEMHEVCRALKLRPKAVNELMVAGVLPSREQGKKTVFFEEGVVRYYMTQGPWKEATAKPANASANADSAEPGAAPSSAPSVDAEGRQRVGVGAASEILDRSLGAVYQLVSTRTIPYHKEGSKVYFYTDDLYEWARNHPPRPRKSKA